MTFATRLGPIDVSLCLFHSGYGDLPKSQKAISTRVFAPSKREETRCR